MGKDKKFRNHISIVAEQVGAGTVTLAMVALGIFIENVDELMEAGFSSAKSGRGLVVGVVLLLFIAAAARQVWSWSKTWIYIEGQTIVIERNTLNQKVNTIGIKNISNINTEQNLFEMLMGTCKIKIDTSSLSTAEKTDVKIVLKKADAEAFRDKVMELFKEAAGNRKEGNTAEPDGHMREVFDVTASLSDILRHGFCSVSVFSLLLVIAGVGGLSEVISRMAEKGEAAQSVLGSLIGIVAAFSFILSAVWDIVKDFIRYFEFSAKRSGNDIHIRYGILKKVEYTVPVDKIQALKMHQTWIARMAGMYMVELINIGIGDDKAEKKSFFILYGKKRDVEAKIEKLLPEFSGKTGEKAMRQPALVLAARAVPLVIYEGALFFGAVKAFGFLEEYSTIVIAAASLAGMLVPLLMVLDYFTASLSVDDGFLSTTSGYFGRTIITVKYDKIQYVEFKRGIFARLCGIQKGSFSLLAAAGMREHNIPYFRPGLEEKIKENLLGM